MLCRFMTGVCFSMERDLLGNSRDPIAVHLHIGESIFSSGAEASFEHVNAHTGRVQAIIPAAGATDIDAAVQIAAKAFEGWRRTRPTERRNALIRLANIIISKADEFARLISLENGTPVMHTIHQATNAYNWLTYYAGWADKLEGQVSSTFMNDRDFSYSVPEPFGVIGGIIPWNGPLNSLAMKTAPALAAGNTIVIKASELAPFS